MSREHAYRAIDEPEETLSPTELITALTQGISEWANMVRIDSTVRSLRRLLQGSSMSFGDGAARILENGTGLEAYIGHDTGEESGEAYSFVVGWDESKNIGDILATRRESVGGEIIEKSRFGSGQSAPEITGLANTLPLRAVRRELVRVTNSLDRAIKTSKKHYLD